MTENSRKNEGSTAEMLAGQVDRRVMLSDGSKVKKGFALSVIADQLQGWLDFNEDEWKKEGKEPGDDTKVMSPPVWPSRGVLKNWIAALRA